MTLYILTALGGAIGATLRFGIGRWAQDFFGQPGFPYGTLLINVTGCVVFGFIMGLVDKGYPIGTEQRTFMLVGILGGYTTFSTFGFETFAFLRDGQLEAALLNAALQVVIGVLGVWLGTVAARLL